MSLSSKVNLPKASEQGCVFLEPIKVTTFWQLLLPLHNSSTTIQDPEFTGVRRHQAKELDKGSDKNIVCVSYA
ncbi:MAG: hypothetical protein CME71_07340 [Halobacteriovorax sp.]|nr:hypothetical protein [Halobacteriovorax sp.]|tara:strand:- start:894 stop:1112 length:219 start_codon:yes stop_codon:yes gene_type:complete